jgi:uncharacterized repeat protein (TIGR03803 family)
VNGKFVNGGLVRNAQTAKLYGTTLSGGPAESGVVFELEPPDQLGDTWKETVLYSFTGGNGGEDGATPVSGLIADSDGALYGTTAGGGKGGNGTIFRISPPVRAGDPWTKQSLYSFRARGDGSEPRTRLVLDSAGSLYGVTFHGGENGTGTVFELSPPSNGNPKWTETVLHSFPRSRGASPDGTFPETSLILDNAGNLYGTTSRGGEGCFLGCGTVFRLSPPALAGGAWTESVLYGFRGNSDGGFPLIALTLDPAGALYGNTASGGKQGFGTIFKLNPPADGTVPWTKTVINEYPSLGGVTGGELLLIGSKFYGTTFAGGLSNTGTVFEIEP